MYESFYGFSKKPFSLLPDPLFLYLSGKHRKVLTMMEFGIVNMNAGYTVITGDIGTGKTILIRRLLKQVGMDYTIGLINNTHKYYGDLLQWILLAFGLDYKGKGKAERFETLIGFLVDQYVADRRTILIIDEAQNMTPDMLEELRTLSNINDGDTEMLQLILVGQPELRTTLQSPELEQFAQRVTVSYHLQPLNKAEGVGYIRHRLKIAGGKPDIFDVEACVAVWYVSHGIPRLINTISDQALVYGFADKIPKIGLSIIKDVARDRAKTGIVTRNRKDIKNHDSKMKAVHS